MVAFARVAAILLLVAGIIWTGQGLGWIGGSFMTGSAFWAVMGLICIVAGGFLATRYIFQPRR